MYSKVPCIDIVETCKQLILTKSFNIGKLYCNEMSINGVCSM